MSTVYIKFPRRDIGMYVHMRKKAEKQAEGQMVVDDLAGEGGKIWREACYKHKQVSNQHILHVTHQILERAPPLYSSWQIAYNT